MLLDHQALMHLMVNFNICHGRDNQLGSMNQALLDSRRCRCRRRRCPRRWRYL